MNQNEPAIEEIWIVEMIRIRRESPHSLYPCGDRRRSWRSRRQPAIVTRLLAESEDTLTTTRFFSFGITFPPL
ncbi:hypothetical protein Y032_0246g31 [Ancylostoma ceylanicum]|uniref:Uncharacterized protein n=1 Tax=Ancylostoma ceylanicum TaxID=53326 RepID=A0A016SDN4_9BILA|nr:hypothetical protein Y032_0246g31 [Ancylostoma ceylanicum]